ncbi:MAG: hypothetical protein FWF79_06310 [Defluviitaleaceae bacterium]|nr:hypothetical protein [Defluviitaleaceae bacterium]
MLKADFIHSLKQTNVSRNKKKTMELIKEFWRPLEREKRDEILALAGVKKPSIERAYKTGMVSAKIITAMAIVLEVDPFYLAGLRDTNRPFDQKFIFQFLSELGYEISKNALLKQSKKPNLGTETTETTEAPKTATTNSGFNDLTAVSAEISRLLDKDAQKRIQNLSEEELILMINSLGIQAKFSAFKKSRLELIKYLLIF